MTMALQRLCIFALALACLLVVPSWSDESQVSHEDRNAGEPNGLIRVADDKNKNKNENRKENKLNKARNKKEKKKENNFKKQHNKLEIKKEKEYRKIKGSSTKMGPCNGTFADWSCCSSTNPCQEKQGDCDGDTHCAGSLVCGKDNCRDFHKQAEKLADCCIGPGTGTVADWNFCKSSSPCQENQGDCDTDSDCAGSLVCGNNNCASMNSQAHAQADCCIQPAGTGSSSDWSFCSSSSPCSEKQGDCDSDSDCSGSLVCGTDNCKDFHPQASAVADCCIKPDTGTGTSSDWNFCSSSSPCQRTQGDCDSDSECAGSLVCGHNNCRDFNSHAHSIADCCIEASCQCGVKKQGTRIVGGVESQVNSYPWMVLLSMGCGGSVIADRWVLTAAHCFYRNGVQSITDASTVTITLGEHDRTVSTETLLTKTVIPDKIIIHDSYDISKDLNDLALLRLPSAIDVNIYTPVCLPRQGEVYTDQKVWVYGWGALSQGGSLSATLQELEITVVDDDVAKTKYGLTDTQLAAMVFAGGEKGKDACQGDSGGPLSYDRNGQHELVGATSWGYGCAQDGFPGAYTEVSTFRSWIDQKIAGANTC